MRMWGEVCIYICIHSRCRDRSIAYRILILIAVCCAGREDFICEKFDISKARDLAGCFDECGWVGADVKGLWAERYV